MSVQYKVVEVQYFNGMRHEINLNDCLNTNQRLARRQLREKVNAAPGKSFAIVKVEKKGK